MEYKFMQIYGNCAATHYLGKDRIRGPVDNVLTKNYQTIDLLLTNKYLDYLKNNIPEIKERTPNFEGDSAIGYCYNLIDVVHQDPRTDKYLAETAKRINNFNSFLANIKKPDYYFVYSLNIYDLDNKTHKLKFDRLEKNIKYLKQKKLLDKTIFVGTINNNWWNFWSSDMVPLIKKYNLKYLELDNVGMGICDDTETIKQFNWKVKDLIKNGTNEKYFWKRTKDGKFIKPKPPKEQKSYLGINNYFGI